MPHRRDELEREAARLRYELARLRAKRSVRLAQLATQSGSPADVWRTLRGVRVQRDWDVIAPFQVPAHPRYPHLSVVSPSVRSPFGWVAPYRRVASEQDLVDARADLLVLDREDLTVPGSGSLVAAARREGVPSLAITGDATQIRCARQLGVDVVMAVTPSGEMGDGADLCVPPWVDAAHDNPIGWVPEAPALVVDDQDPVQHVHDVLCGLARGRSVISMASGALPPDVRAFVSTEPGPATTAGDRSVDRQRRLVRASRHVLVQHEALARFEAVLDALDIPCRPPPVISVLLATRRPNQLAHALEQVRRQDHPSLQVVLALHGHPFSDADLTELEPGWPWPMTVLRQPERRPLGDVLNAALDLAHGELIAKMDDDDHYGSHHLSDLEVALRYSAADAVGRWANDVHLASTDETVAQDLDRQERWAHHLPGATMLVRGEVLRSVRFRRVASAIDTELVRSIHAAGGTTYATHRFGFVRTRHGRGHTHTTRPDRLGVTDLRAGFDASTLEL